MGRFSNRVALVTGSGRGIGWETLRLLAQEGAAVAVNDVDAERVSRRLAELLRDGYRAIGVGADATHPDQVERMVSSVVGAFGRLDILVNNVGGSYPSTKRFIEELTLQEWDAIVELNVGSHFLCSKAALPHMKRQNYGRIINVGSIAAVAGDSPGGIWSPAYAAAKAATLGLMRQMALEVGHYGILVNGVAPTDVLTELVREHTHAGWYYGSEVEVFEAYSSFPVPRLCRPEEVAKVIAFLASDDASLVAGETVMITGGSYTAP